MQISNTIALVTGANRGLGLAFFAGRPQAGPGGRPGAPVTRRPRSAEARYADQVALGVGEVAHDQA